MIFNLFCNGEWITIHYSITAIRSKERSSPQTSWIAVEAAVTRLGCGTSVFPPAPWVVLKRWRLLTPRVDDNPRGDLEYFLSWVFLQDRWATIPYQRLRDPGQHVSHKTVPHHLRVIKIYRYMNYNLKRNTASTTSLYLLHEMRMWFHYWLMGRVVICSCYSLYRK